MQKTSHTAYKNKIDKKTIYKVSIIFILLLSYIFFVIRWSKDFHYKEIDLSDTSLAIIATQDIKELFVGVPFYCEYVGVLDNKEVIKYNINVVYNFIINDGIPVSHIFRKVKLPIKKGDSIIFYFSKKWQKETFRKEAIFATDLSHLSQKEPLFYMTKLPILIINTKDSLIASSFQIANYKYLAGNHTYNSILDKPLLKGQVKIKIRGKTSRSFPKKQYSIHIVNKNGLKKDVRIPEFIKDNEFVLYGPYVDVSAIRNVITYDIYRKMGHFAPHTQLVELVINNDYRGVYVLIEKIKKSKIGLSQCETNCYNNFLIKIDTPDSLWWQHGCFRIKNSDYISEPDDSMKVEYYIQTICPRYETSRNCALKIAHLFDTISYGILNNDTLIQNRFINYNHFIDYLIINELTKNVDAYRISTFFFRKNGSPLMAGPPWDYNFAYGNVAFANATSPNGFMFKYPMTLFWWRYLYKNNPLFRKELAERWFYLRSTALSEQNIFELIDNYANMLNEPMKREYERWRHYNNSEYFRQEKVKNYNDEIIYLKSWIKKRLIWIDNNIKSQ